MATLHIPCQPHSLHLLCFSPSALFSQGHLQLRPPQGSCCVSGQHCSPTAQAAEGPSRYSCLCVDVWDGCILPEGAGSSAEVEGGIIKGKEIIYRWKYVPLREQEATYSRATFPQSKWDAAWLEMVGFGAGAYQGVKGLCFCSSVHLGHLPDCGIGLNLRGLMASWVSVARTSCTAIAILWPGLHWGCRHPQPTAQLTSFQAAKLPCPSWLWWSLLRGCA